MTALEEFEQKTLEDMWQAICFEFPPPPPPPGPLAVERNYHQHYVDLRSRSFLGREALIERIERHCDADISTETQALVVVGSAGSGKTSLAMAFARRYGDKHATVHVIVHVVSASPTSTDIRQVLMRLTAELAGARHPSPCAMRACETSVCVSRRMAARTPSPA